MPNPITNYLRRHFGFSGNEIRGLFLFVPLTIFILFVPQILKRLLQSPTDDSADKELLMEWRKEMLAKLDLDSKSSEIKIVAKHFNPNKLTSGEWIELGFEEDIASRIINYRLKGGVFRKKEDLLKIYGINERLVNEYQEYIIIPPPSKKENLNRPVTKFKPKANKKEVVKINLNGADTLQLMTINGIGPYWSNRIVRYRDLLGGFETPEQMYEMYGIDSSLVELVLEHSFFEANIYDQININQDSVKMLAKHPYISYKTANAIVRFRKQHGDYQQIAELKKIISISDSVFFKMAPYLKISE